jgi:DUF1365 family protein
MSRASATPGPNALARSGDTRAAQAAARAIDAAGTARALHSAIYEGWVRHRRYRPHAHAFRFRVAMMYLDLDEIDDLFAHRWLWSARGRNLAEFRRSDYLGAPGQPLVQAVRDCVRDATGSRPEGPIRLLTHLRYYGHCFNPVSFYYCFAADGSTLEAIVAEITNTPWRERHRYVLPRVEAEHGGGALAWSFRKAFHVSPFLPLQCDYAWRFTVPGPELRVHMDVLRDGARELDATLVLERRAPTGANLARVLWRYPLLTLRVLGAIHWQALRLWLRRNPVYDHPLSGGS